MINHRFFLGQTIAGTRRPQFVNKHQSKKVVSVSERRRASAMLASKRRVGEESIKSICENTQMEKMSDTVTKKRTKKSIKKEQKRLDYFL